MGFMIQPAKMGMICLIRLTFYFCHLGTDQWYCTAPTSTLCKPDSLHKIRPWYFSPMNLATAPTASVWRCWSVFHNILLFVHLLWHFRLQNLCLVKIMFVPSFQDEITLNMVLGAMIKKSKALRITAACSWLASEHGDILIFKQRSFVFLPLPFCVPALS